MSNNEGENRAPGQESFSGASEYANLAGSTPEAPVVKGLVVERDAAGKVIPEAPGIITEVPSAAELAKASPEKTGFKVEFKTDTRVAVKRSNRAKNQAEGIAGQVEYDWKTRLAEPGDIDKKTGQVVPIAEGYTRVAKTSPDRGHEWKDIKNDDLAAEQPGFQTGGELALPDRPGERWHVESQSLTGEVKLVRIGGESNEPGVMRLAAAELATMLQPKAETMPVAEPVLRGLKIEPAAPDSAPGPRYVDPEPAAQAPVSPGVFEGRSKLPTVVRGAQAPIGSAPRPAEAAKPSLWKRLTGQK